MRRAVTSLFVVSIVLALASAALAGGGQSPPPPGFKVQGPAVTAYIVIDAHGPSVPGNPVDSGRASIRLQKGGLVTGGQFVSPGADNLFSNFGCDASRTDGRFVDLKLTAFIPSDVVQALFADLGIAAIPFVNDPIITDVDNAVCSTADGNTSLPAPGTLSFQALIQFVVPQK